MDKCPTNVVVVQAGDAEPGVSRKVSFSPGSRTVAKFRGQPCLAISTILLSAIHKSNPPAVMGPTTNLDRGHESASGYAVDWASGGLGILIPRAKTSMKKRAAKIGSVGARRREKSTHDIRLFANCAVLIRMERNSVPMPECNL